MSRPPEPATTRDRRLSDADRRLVAVLQLLGSGLPPLVDQVIAGELTFADRQAWGDMFDRAADMVRGRIVDGAPGSDLSTAARSCRWVASLDPTDRAHLVEARPDPRNSGRFALCGRFVLCGPFADDADKQQRCQICEAKQ